MWYEFAVISTERCNVSYKSGRVN